MKALVLGGSTGLVGQALVRELAARGWSCSTLGREDGNLFDLDFLTYALGKAAADVVFNTVAWTQVDAAEDNPNEAALINRVFADGLARSMKALPRGHLIHFSTDFVFGKAEHKPLKESDQASPCSVYGSTKLEGEQAVQAALPGRSCIVRTAWIFGPGRKNFVRTILDACKKKDVLNVVDDQVGSPTFTNDLAEWSVSLAEKGATGIWHAVNSGQASWCELACEAISLTQAPCRIMPIKSEQWPQKASRPAWSVLDNSKLAEFLGKKPRPWPNALRDYIFGPEIQGALS